MSLDPSAALADLASTLASAVPDVDARAEHDRWKPGIGPFEEEKQIEMLLDAIDEESISEYIQSEQTYPDQGLRSDLVIETADTRIPVEAKLLRFRYDNGNIDPASYARIFTPFPERTSSSLLTDAKKLSESNFDPSGGLLRIYYEKDEEPYEQMSAETVAEKFCIDVGYWFGFEVEIATIARFDGLRHPHHQRGAVITWEIDDA